MVGNVILPSQVSALPQLLLPATNTYECDMEITIA